MVEVITKANRHLYDSVLEEMYEQRYRLLIKGLGWNVPGCQPDRDVDDFDTEDTVYLVESHPETSQLIASCRLNPTIKPHLLSEVFADQCELRGVPQGETIWELSRVAYDHQRSTGELFRKTRAVMRLAIAEFCIATGIQSLTWLSRRDMYATISTFWPTRPLGGSRYYPDDQEYYVAAISDIDDLALVNSRAKFVEHSKQDLVLTSLLPSNSWGESLISSITVGKES